MLLIKAEIGPFRSIESPQTLRVESGKTALVGMNESGKTVVLKALSKARDGRGLDEFSTIEDYPRKDLVKFQKRGDSSAQSAVVLTYKPGMHLVQTVNSQFGLSLTDDFEFTVTHHYSNRTAISIVFDSAPAVRKIIDSALLSTDCREALASVTSLRVIPEVLDQVSLTENDETFKSSVEARIAKTKWDDVIQWEVWQRFSQEVPHFLYFSDYDVLPGKMNLSDLARRVELAQKDPNHLKASHRAVLALVRMADIEIDDLLRPESYEEVKAKIEAISINLTDQIMEFWKQNEDLEVEIDVKQDPADDAPFNDGLNLYLRIKNRKQRGVSTSFDQRSKGFIWFFSFQVWFNDVKEQLEKKSSANRFILLLDEPGLSLHARAQEDFLAYIDSLTDDHQVIYTTHSPFMISSDGLSEVRLIENRSKVGTVISENWTSADPRTLFPLQAALGYDIAQNLFVSKRNLIVEGVSELSYLQAMTSILEARSMTSLSDKVVITPVGGIDKIATFVALLNGNKLKLAVFHDYSGKPDPRLQDLVKDRILSEKAVLTPSQFRNLDASNVNGVASDIEDMFSPELYLQFFNKAFKNQLKGHEILENDLPPGSRITERISRLLKNLGISMKAGGGFNHFTVASVFASNPPILIDDSTLKSFSSLFDMVNALLEAD